MHRKYRNKQRDNMKKQLHALYLDKIIQYSSCMKRFAYDWSRWQILNMAFKFLFILFMVASFGMALWMCGVSPLFLVSKRSDFCFVLYVFFLSYFILALVEWFYLEFLWRSANKTVLVLLDHMVETHVCSAQHTVLLHRMKWVYFSHWDEKWLRHIEGKHCICVWISSFTEFDSSFCNLFFAINLSKVLYRR